MATYLFSVPLINGKTKAWKNYIKEIKDNRYEDYKRSRQNAGIRTEQATLQHTPGGDMIVVRIEADDINKVFGRFFQSNEPFDVWFKEKVLMETHGMDPNGEIPRIEPVSLEFQVSERTETRAYAETRKNR